MCIYKLDGGRRYITDNSGNTGELSARYHRLFAYVPQGNQLMSGTIREVVCFSDRRGLHDDERISNALKIACADEFVCELDDGVDTLLGERGTGLSEGQMQRIAIARAVYSECPILLLDEATSALDEATERRVLENLRNMTDKTVIVVTHRPAALEICDRILQFTENGVIENG
jgi:ATP-binding cassette subfamily B protein